MEKIDEGLEELYEKYPDMQRVRVSSGLRGIRYFIEFPIVARHVDAFTLLSSTNQQMDAGKKKEKFAVRVTGNDSYLSEDAVAYSIDYKVKATVVGGSFSAGSVYIRGTKGHEGYDSFKFSLEKANDFSDFDAQLILNAYEQAFKAGYPDSAPQNKVVEEKFDDKNLTPAQIKFRKKMAAKNREGGNQ